MSIEFIQEHFNERLNANDEKFGQVVLTDGGEFVVVVAIIPPQKHFVAIGPNTGFGQRITVAGRRVVIRKIVGTFG